MTPLEIHDKIADIPHMTLDDGVMFTDHIIKHNIKNVLELGFYQGVSTCYIANALLQTGGSITTIDKKNSLLHKPNIYDLLEKCKLRNVEIYTEYQSYTWRLMHMIENKNNYRFDLAFIDAGHIWDDTGFAFFLVDQLLSPGGWIIFDDYTWSIDNSSSSKIKRTRQFLSFPKEYVDEFCSTQQVKKVIELLVRPHPEYTIIDIVDNRYVFAQKKMHT